MGYRERYTWIYNKTCGETFNKRWINFNARQCLQSTKVGSPIYVKIKTNHSAIVPREVAMG